MHLTEKQCALLSGFMYLDQSVKKSDDNGNKNIIGKIIEYLKDETTGQFDREQLDPSGGITKEEAVELLKEIERDPVLRNLKAVHSVDTGIRATCFVDSKAGDTKDAIVAFRGTGGITRAWEDNIVGAYEPVTAMQQEAVDFVRDTCGDYMISQVTGHSKGGNLAMHVTIASEQNITDCVVFDAQGFNSLYFNENRNLIEQTAKYIKSINADKDFVSPLLNPAALPENTVYIKIGDVKSFGENHKLTMLLKNELFDSEGKYRQEVYGERVFGSNQISKATRALDSSGFLRTGFGKTLTDLIAVEVGARMTNEPEQSKAIRFEEKAKEYRAIRSGIFHVDNVKFLVGRAGILIFFPLSSGFFVDRGRRRRRAFADDLGDGDLIFSFRNAFVLSVRNEIRDAVGAGGSAAREVIGAVERLERNHSVGNRRAFLRDRKRDRLKGRHAVGSFGPAA